MTKADKMMLECGYKFIVRNDEMEVFANCDNEIIAFRLLMENYLGYKGEEKEAILIDKTLQLAITEKMREFGWYEE